MLLRQVFLHSSPNKRNVKEAAALLGICERTVYSWMEADKSVNIPPDSLAAISRFLIIEYNDSRLADHLLPDGAIAILPSAIRVNGDISDEVLRMDEIMGEIITAWRGADYSRVSALASNLAAEIGQMKAEAQAKTGRTK